MSDVGDNYETDEARAVREAREAELYPFEDGTNPESVDPGDTVSLDSLAREQLDDVDPVLDDDDEVLADNLDWDE